MHERAAAGKTFEELLELEDTVEAQLDGGEAADPEYWTALLKRLHIAKVGHSGTRRHARSRGLFAPQT